MNICVAGGCATTPSFGFTGGTGVVMKMSGGAINLVNSNGLTTADYNQTGTMVYTGGTLNVGTADTVTNFNFRAQGQMPAVVVDNTTNNKNLLLSGQGNVWGVLTTNPGTTVNVNPGTAQTLLQIGPAIVNNGAIVTNVNNTGTVNFAGSLQAVTSYAQSYTGTGTLGTGTVRLSTLSVQNAPGLTIDPSVSTLNVNRINLFYGGVTNADKIGVGQGDAVALVIQRGATGIAFHGGSLDLAPTFNIGAGGLTLVYSQSQGLMTTGPEIPASRTVLSIQVIAPDGVTLLGGDLTSTGTTNGLLLSSGALDTTSHRLILTGATATAVTGGSAASYVRGPLVRTLPANLVSGSTYTFPVGKGSFKMLELVNPTTNAGGTVTIEAEAFDADSGGTGSVDFFDINHDRYWSVEATAGGANFTNTTVRLTEQGTPTGNAIGQSATQQGVYDSIGGAPLGATIGPSNLITTLGYFAVGRLITASTLSGSYTVGAGGDYATLTAAVADLNTKLMSGPVTFLLTDNAYAAETFPITINANGGNSATNTLTIKPASGASPVFSGTPSSALIVLNGIDYVTIDGSNSGGGTRDMTFTNNALGATTAVIWGQTIGTANPTTNNTIKNLNLSGNASTTTLAGVGFGSSTISAATAGTRNDNNRVQNNSVTTAQFGVISQGAQSPAKNRGTVITGNTLGGNGAATLGRAGVYVGFEDGVQVTNNTVVNVNSAVTGSDVFGIALGSIAISGSAFTTNNDVANATVTGNFIGNVAQTVTYSAAGISSGTPSYGTTRIANNSISGVLSNGTAGDFTVGIYAGSTGTLYATTEIYFNSVSMTGARDAALPATTGSYALAILGGNPLANVRDNALYNTQTATNGGGAGTAGSYAIGLSAIGLYNFLTSDYNDLYSSGASSHFSSVGVLASTTTAQVPFWDRSTFVAWKSETGKDASSISVDPMFGSATNLRPLPGSPLLGAGQPVFGITTDIVGDTRADPPTIGAYENPSTPPAPPNDDFGNADILTELQGVSGTRSGDNTYATIQTGEPAHAGFGPFKSLWYRFTPTTSRTIRFDTCNAGFDTVLAAYTGPAVDNLTPVSSNDDFCGSGGTRSRIQFLATSGTTYYIAVAGKTSGAFGSFTLSFTDAFPPNDDLADAQAQNGSGIVTGTTVAATGEPNENVPVCTPTCSPLPLNSVWYRYTASMTGSVTIDTCSGTTLDTIIAAYTGTGYPLIQEAANDDTVGCGNGLQSRITFAITSGSQLLRAGG